MLMDLRPYWFGRPLPMSLREYLLLTYAPTPSLIFAAYAEDSAEPN